MELSSKKEFQVNLICSFCERESVAFCCQCHRPVCSKHSHCKDSEFDNNFAANLAGHRYRYEVLCEDCDRQFLISDLPKLLLAYLIFLILLLPVIGSILSLVL